jgi:protein gp37
MASQKTLEAPLHWKAPRMIFVNSMSDLFHPDVNTEWIDDILDVMMACPQHTFQVLTKRPELMDEKLYGVTLRNGCRALGGGDYLPNLWLGVSVEDQATADARIPILLKTLAAVRFVSYEPALGPVNFCAVPDSKTRPAQFSALYSPLGDLDWVIAGGESGPGARPYHPDWFRSVRDQCLEAGVSFFFKQFGEWEVFYDEDRDDPDCRYVPKESSRVTRINLAGGRGAHGDRIMYLRLVGKKKSGALLDGREWKEFPK